MEVQVKEEDKIAKRVLREHRRLRESGNTDELLLDKVIRDMVVSSGFVGEALSFAHSNIKKIVTKKIQGIK